MNTIILIVATALLYGASSFAVAYLCLQEWMHSAPTPRQIIGTALAIIFSPLIIILILLYGAVIIIWGVCELLVEEWKNDKNNKNKE